MTAQLQTDVYKLGHKEAYDESIVKAYSNFTSRNGRLSNIPDYLSDGVVNVGLQYFIKDYLIESWNEDFFCLNKDAAIGVISRTAESILGEHYDVTHFEDLWELGYLPLEIKALDEGVVVPYGVPCITITNTVDGFQWLVNYIETVMSTEIWPIQTSATTARAYQKNLNMMYEKTGADNSLQPFMCHDFSMRGCFGRHAAAMSGFGHLTASAGTDTIPAVLFAEKYYNADLDTELVGASVFATEHSTATSAILKIENEKGLSKTDAEVEYVKYLFNKRPTGILSHVSDSFDFWSFVTNGLPKLRDDIMSRDGTFVVRPDSGDPVLILCGDPDASEGSAEYKGLIECLWDIFGGSETKRGYKQLDSHIGAIYGDSITLERQSEIYNRLMNKGFVPSVVLGVGSYSYQYVTRDTHGSAVKMTWVKTVEGNSIDVCKDPATDSKKKSAKGLLRVEKQGGGYVLFDSQSEDEERLGELDTVFMNGELVKETSLHHIRENIKKSI